MKNKIALCLGLLVLLSTAARAEESYGKENGVLGPVTFGPKFTVAVPQVLKFGVEAKFLNIVGLSFDYGFLPSISYNDVAMKVNGWTIAGRFFIFQRALFIGVGFGQQDLAGSQTDTVLGESVTATATFSQTFLAPHIGWRWTGSDGLYFGMELGVQFPLSYSSTVTTNNAALNSNPTVQQMIADSQAQADKYGHSPLPWLGLFTVGYYF